MNETPLFEVGKIYKTRDGHDARVICTDAAGDYPVVALVRSNYGVPEDSPEMFRVDGKIFGYGSSFDLVHHAPEKIVRYVNIYCESDFSERCYSSRAAADLGADSDRIACVRVEFHKGQFDE